jgi:hypothetical protein
MSEIARLAEAEAQRAEAEDEQPAEPAAPGDEPTEPADEDDPGEGVNDEAAQQAQAQETKRQEKAMRDLGKENDRHAAAVAKIMGEDFTIVSDCPLCEGLGFVFPPETMPDDPLRRQAVYIALGDPPVPDYRSHDAFRACEKCDGYGQVKTGAKAPGIEHLPCPTCQGTGYVGNVESPPQAPVFELPVIPPPPPAVPGFPPVPVNAQPGYLDPATGEFVRTG